MGRITSGKDYVKWEKPGQVVEGTLRRIEMSRGGNAGKMLHMVDADGKPFMVSAPTLLAEVVEDNFDELHDEFLQIVFVSEDKPAKKGQSGLRRFEVKWGDDLEK